jgi:HEAT repeat protein
LTVALKRRSLANAEFREIALYLDVFKTIGPALGQNARPAGEAIVALLPETCALYRGKTEREIHRFRAYALVALGEMGPPPSALPFILDYLNNKESDMQFAHAAAAFALGRMGAGYKQAEPLLVRLLDHAYMDGPVTFASFASFCATESPTGRYTSVRLEVIRALGRFGPAARTAMPALRNLSPRVTTDARLPEYDLELKNTTRLLTGEASK